jgi:4-amino-4-deoxy-L-arabinose transferase-like glycosyltransferase
MSGEHLGAVRVICLMGLAALALLPGLGTADRLTYHEAFVAQGAREMLASGQWGYPTIGGVPWLEKPPLPWWLVTALGRCTGGISETVGRLPSALAAIGLVLGVAVLGARHYGRCIGTLAGAIQATTAWTVMRGRLAEADVLLACTITWAMVAFDTVGDREAGGKRNSAAGSARRWCLGRWAFFLLLGISALIKGIGFGAILILAIVATVLLWEQDHKRRCRLLQFPVGWALAVVIGLAWPLAMVARHGTAALELWTLHIVHRVGGQPGPFAGEPWWEYMSGVVGQALPWAPLTLAGAWCSLSRGVHLRPDTGLGAGRCISDGNPRATTGGRLLWSWALVPLALLSLASVRNAHYVVSAQVPWSIWAALALTRLGNRLRQRGWAWTTLQRAAHIGFAALALGYGLSLWLVGPWFDRRGVEWAFYESVSRQLSPCVPLALLYDDWDRDPYPNPFGSIPHDLAVRLFYLGRPACWHLGAETLASHEHASARRSWIEQPGESDPCRVCSQSTVMGCSANSDKPSPQTFGVIGRNRDIPALTSLGRVEVMAHGPSLRRDRTYALFRVTPMVKPQDGSAPIATAENFEVQR